MDIWKYNGFSHKILVDFVYKSSVNSSAKGQMHQLPRKNILQVSFSNHTGVFLWALARLITSITAQKQEL